MFLCDREEVAMVVLLKMEDSDGEEVQGRMGTVLILVEVGVGLRCDVMQDPKRRDFSMSSFTIHLSN